MYVFYRGVYILTEVFVFPLVTLSIMTEQEFCSNKGYKYKENTITLREHSKTNCLLASKSLLHAYFGNLE